MKACRLPVKERANIVGETILLKADSFLSIRLSMLVNLLERRFHCFATIHSNTDSNNSVPMLSRDEERCSAKATRHREASLNRVRMFLTRELISLDFSVDVALESATIHPELVRCDILCGCWVTVCDNISPCTYCNAGEREARRASRSCLPNADVVWFVREVDEIDFGCDVASLDSYTETQKSSTLSDISFTRRDNMAGAKKCSVRVNVERCTMERSNVCSPVQQIEAANRYDVRL